MPGVALALLSGTLEGVLMFCETLIGLTPKSDVLLIIYDYEGVNDAYEGTG